MTTSNNTLKEFNFEIYTKHPETGERGWDIKFRSVLAPSKEEAREAIKASPLFDTIILFNYGGMDADEEILDLYETGVRAFDRHSYMNNDIVELHKY